MGPDRYTDERDRPAHVQFVCRPGEPVSPPRGKILTNQQRRSTEFYDIVDMLDKRLNDKGKNWRHVLKALKVLDYCLHEGSAMVVTWARKNIYVIKTLREFMYIDEDGRDVGQNGGYSRIMLAELVADRMRSPSGCQGANCSYSRRRET
jgi:epsin